MSGFRHPLPKAVRIPSEDIAECEQGAERLRAKADELQARRALWPSIAAEKRRSLGMELGLARSALLGAAKLADEGGFRETHRQLMGALAHLDDAREAANG